MSSGCDTALSTTTLHAHNFGWTLEWPKGLAYNNGGLHSTSSLMQWWLPTPPTGGGGGARMVSLRRGPTPKRVPHRVPNPGRRTFRHVSRFTSPLHGVPSPTMQSFRIVSRFGSTLHGVPNPTMQSFRVVSCFTGCPIPELGLCQQQVHRLSRYGCVLLCVSRQCAEPHALRTQKKNSLADRPIYHFHFNIHFLKAPLALHWSQALRHSVTSYAPACAPHAIVYFRCLLESLPDFRSGACRFCATEAAKGAFPLLARGLA